MNQLKLKMNNRNNQRVKTRQRARAHIFLSKEKKNKILENTIKSWAFAILREMVCSVAVDANDIHHSCGSVLFF